MSAAAATAGSRVTNHHLTRAVIVHDLLAFVPCRPNSHRPQGADHRGRVPCGRIVSRSFTSGKARLLFHEAGLYSRARATRNALHAHIGAFAEKSISVAAGGIGMPAVPNSPVLRPISDFACSAWSRRAYRFSNRPQVFGGSLDGVAAGPRLGDSVWKTARKRGRHNRVLRRVDLSRRSNGAGPYAAELHGDTAYVIRLAPASAKDSPIWASKDALVFFDGPEFGKGYARCRFPFTAYLGRARALIALGRTQKEISAQGSQRRRATT